MSGNGAVAFETPIGAYCQARALVGAALQGSSAGLVALIDQVREALSQAAGRIDPAKQRVNETIARTKSLGE